MKNFAFVSDCQHETGRYISNDTIEAKDRSHIEEKVQVLSCRDKMELFREQCLSQ